MKEIIKDYLWLDKFKDIDNQKLYNTCCEIGETLEKVLPPISEEHSYGSFSSFYYKKYNLFSYVCPEIHKLYAYISKSVADEIDPNTTYYIQAWVNLFQSGMHIDWHGHWPPDFKVYHGFYCVNSETTNSYTDYKIPGQKDIIRIMSEDGLLVFGKSDGDEHRSSPWDSAEKYRVTIAFDLVPAEAVILTADPSHKFNHYLPFF